MGLLFVDCDCDEGFEGPVFLWNAIAMRASKGLYFSVDCDCNEDFEGAILFCGLQLR